MLRGRITSADVDRACSGALVPAVLVMTGLALCAAGVNLAYAQTSDYPRRPIRLVAPVAPGGGLDIVTRAAAQMLTARFGHSAIVDNRPGGGTVIAMDIVAKAAPDGYTLFSGTDTYMMVGALKRVAYDVRTAFEPIARMTAQPAVMVIAPALPVNSVAQFVAYAKARPKALSFGSAGIGTNGHLGLERFNRLAGVHIVHVPYKGSAPALLDIVAGQIHMVFASTISASPFIKSGRLKALAVTGLTRVAALPDLPTISEAGVPGFKMSNSFNLLAPAGTPGAILQILNDVVAAGMHAPEMAKRLVSEGSEPGERMTPAQFKQVIAAEYLEFERELSKLDIKW